MNQDGSRMRNAHSGMVEASAEDRNDESSKSEPVRTSAPHQRRVPVASKCITKKPETSRPVYRSRKLSSKSGPTLEDKMSIGAADNDFAPTLEKDDSTRHQRFFDAPGKVKASRAGSHDAIADRFDVVMAADDHVGTSSYKCDGVGINRLPRQFDQVKAMPISHVRTDEVSAVCYEDEIARDVHAAVTGKKKISDKACIDHGRRLSDGRNKTPVTQTTKHENRCVRFEEETVRDVPTGDNAAVVKAVQTKPESYPVEDGSGIVRTTGGTKLDADEVLRHQASDIHRDGAPLTWIDEQSSSSEEEILVPFENEIMPDAQAENNGAAVNLSANEMLSSSAIAGAESRGRSVGGAPSVAKAEKFDAIPLMPTAANEEEDTGAIEESQVDLPPVGTGTGAEDVKIICQHCKSSPCDGNIFAKQSPCIQRISDCDRGSQAERTSLLIGIYKGTIGRRHCVGDEINVPDCAGTVIHQAVTRTLSMQNYVRELRNVQETEE